MGLRGGPAAIGLPHPDRGHQYRVTDDRGRLQLGRDERLDVLTADDDHGGGHAQAAGGVHRRRGWSSRTLGATLDFLLNRRSIATQDCS